MNCVAWRCGIAFTLQIMNIAVCCLQCIVCIVHCNRIAYECKRALFFSRSPSAHLLFVFYFFFCCSAMTLYIKLLIYYTHNAIWDSKQSCLRRLFCKWTFHFGCTIVSLHRKNDVWRYLFFFIFGDHNANEVMQLSTCVMGQSIRRNFRNDVQRFQRRNLISQFDV